ncbi:MAG: CPBP family intramembrane metalloprotease [Firmicutes bacterium]|nr:CPBP family intramembrane metalloprotease [Bacillota bacterium]
MAGIIFVTVILTMLVVGMVSVSIGSDSFYVGLAMSAVMYAALFAVYWVFRKYAKAEKHYTIQRPRIDESFKILLLGLICIVSFLLLQNVALEFFVWMGYAEPDARFDLNSPHRFLLVIVTTGILPSVVEELLFRGLILHALLPFGKWKAVLISSALFSLFHLSPAQTVYQFIFGIVLALVYLRTKNMLIPMLLHFVNNVAIVTVLFLGGTEEYFVFDAFTITTAIVLGIVGTFVILNLVRSIGRQYRIANPKQFSSQEYITLGVGVLVALVIWISAFIGAGGGNGY